MKIGKGTKDSKYAKFHLFLDNSIRLSQPSNQTNKIELLSRKMFRPSTLKVGVQS